MGFANAKRKITKMLKGSSDCLERCYSFFGVSQIAQSFFGLFPIIKNGSSERVQHSLMDSIGLGVVCKNDILYGVTWGR